MNYWDKTTEVNTADEEEFDWESSYHYSQDPEDVIDREYEEKYNQIFSFEEKEDKSTLLNKTKLASYYLEEFMTEEE